MACYKISYKNYNENGWGPLNKQNKILGIDFNPIHKNEKLGKLADFIVKRKLEVVNENEESFTLVDNINNQKPKKNTLVRKKQYRNYNNDYYYKKNDNKNWYKKNNYQYSFEDSVTPTADWKVVSQFQLSDLNKLSAEVPKVEEVYVY